MRLAHHHPYLEPHRSDQFIAFAHRGGTDSLPENTLASFRHAVSLGYDYLETDVQLTADGVLVAFHDNDLLRTCGRHIRISDVSWQEVSQMRVDGKEPIPLLTELLEEFPETKFNIDAKSDACVNPLIAVLKDTHALPRVCIGSFSHQRIKNIRSSFGSDVCTGASPREVAQWVMGLPPKEPSCFQVPVRQGPLTVVNERTLAKATQNGQPVHVWTIDDVATMEELISLGVQGIMTDQSLVLREVLQKHNLWRQ